MNIKRIVEIAAEISGFTPGFIRSKNRTAEVTIVRHVIIAVTCRLTRYTVTQIGDYLNRDHSTISYAKTQMDDIYNRPGWETHTDMYNKVLTSVYNDMCRELHSSLTLMSSSLLSVKVDDKINPALSIAQIKINSAIMDLDNYIAANKKIT